jgi:23S rRNA pseudouridine955/2504/2580 synthase/23S rRNA pseudouridine1911/1915/1917 synthase
MKHKAFEIIFEDDDVLVLNKKAGILSIPDRYNDDKINLYTLLTSYRGEIYPLHRLDRDTSGVMIYAKNDIAHKDLSDQFQERTVKKIYLAIVEGRLAEDSGKIETALAQSAYQKDKVVVVKKGKEAITYFKVLEKFDQHTFIEVDIKTGRQHQIRVHMAHIGHPLSVDKKYGNREALYAYDIKKRKFNYKQDSPIRPLLNRHSLHAHKLIISHPTTKEKITFEATLPKDMKAVLNQLKKWSGLD